MKNDDFFNDNCYDDRPIVPDGRTIEEIEDSIAKEKERIKDIEFTPDMLYS